jgi:hypothetical protein
MTHGETMGSSFVSALARQDWGSLQACFQDAVQFRALIPKGLREATTSADAARYFQMWFGDADELVLLASDAGQVHDRFHLAYRFRAHEDQWYIVEQHVFYTLQSDQIDRMDVLCSGFRPETVADGR